MRIYEITTPKLPILSESILLDEGKLTDWIKKAALAAAIAVPMMGSAHAYSQQDLAKETQKQLTVLVQHAQEEGVPFSEKLGQQLTQQAIKNAQNNLETPVVKVSQGDMYKDPAYQKILSNLQKNSVSDNYTLQQTAAAKYRAGLASGEYKNPNAEVTRDKPDWK